MYYCPADAIAETIANCPTPHAFTLLVEKLSDNDSIQTFKTWCDPNGYNATVFVRSGYPNWGNGWRLLAPATPPQEYTLPLAEGYIQSGAGSYYWKDQFGIVHVSFCVHKSDGSLENNTVFAVLPAGFRPGRRIYISAVGDGISVGNGMVASECFIGTDGAIVMFHVNDDIQFITGEALFIAAD